MTGDSLWNARGPGQPCGRCGHAFSTHDLGGDCLALSCRCTRFDVLRADHRDENRGPGLLSARPRLLDLYCGGGGMGMGYYLAGFEVVGVDVAKQPRYPFAFFQADAVEFVMLYGNRFDAIHASPPCQAYSRLAARHRDRNYPDLVAATRDAIVEATAAPYVIENVEGAPLHDPVILCGSSFALGTDEFQLRRHRAFETNWPLVGAACNHDGRPVISVAGHAGRAGRNMSGSSDERREAMGAPWLAGDSLPEAIPPAYGVFVGSQLARFLSQKTLHDSDRRPESGTSTELVA